MSRLTTDGLTLAMGERLFCRTFSHAFAAGEVWGVLGPNGSGKTTLLHTLAGLRPPQGGRVLLDGAPLDSMPVRSRARQLGILLQESATTFPAPVRDCVLLGRHPHLGPWQWETPADWQRVERALAAVELAELATQDQNSLSGGERQRLKLATLMVQEPSIWLLDEPTNHLDLHHQIALVGLLCERVRAQQQLLIMSLHDLNLAARFCDHLVLLYGDGRVEAGDAATMLQPARLSALYRHPIRVVNDGVRRLWVAD